MICILSNSYDPYFNLAAEEYLFKNTDEEVFMLWQCHATIVVGKHQNTLAEINYPYVKKNGIRVARRLSGGGTVYHDSGNVNFTFIRNGEEGKLIDYQKNITPIIDLLKGLGIEAYAGKKNEILLDGKKISGNAEHIYKYRILHHGTLLFDSQLDRLNSALQTDTGKFHDKAVQSNRSKVTNILPYLHEKIPVDDFKKYLFKSYMHHKAGTLSYFLKKADLENVSRIARQKYSTWEWIYGYSPKYSFQNKIEIEARETGIFLEVEKGFIQSAVITGDYLNDDEKNLLGEALFQQRHDEEVIKSIINRLLPNLTRNNQTDRFVEGFF